MKTVVYNYGMHTMCFAAGKLLQSMVYMCAIVNYGVSMSSYNVAWHTGWIDVYTVSGLSTLHAVGQASLRNSCTMV